LAALDDGEAVGGVTGHATVVRACLDELAELLGPAGAGAAGASPTQLADRADRARAALAGLDTVLATLAGVMRARAALPAILPEPGGSTSDPVPDAEPHSTAGGEAAPTAAQRPGPDKTDAIPPVRDAASAPDRRARRRAAATAAAGRSASDAANPAVPTRTVADLTEEFGPGWTLTEFVGQDRGRYQVRLNGQIIGVVQRSRSITGRSTTGWEAQRSGLPITSGAGRSWPNRGLAAAAVVDAHQGLHASGRRTRRT
jgi:hypothetical protein